MKQQPQLGNQWAEILSAGTHDGETYTPADFDQMVLEYQKRTDGQKAPVGLGTPSEQRKEAVGKIDALRRVGNSLEGRFADIDPRVERLHGRGFFPKKSIQLKRSPEGVSLQRVGLIHPTYCNGSLTDSSTPSLDELIAQTEGSKEYSFEETPLASQWLELFRAGDYGGKGKFTDSDLDQVVDNFNPAFHEPPAVIGHPEHNAPAYGWVEALKRSGDVLLGKFKQVDPRFEEMVKAGRFKKRSVSLYSTAKGWMLRHVGFLGAQPPEIKGLANAAFKEDQIRFITLTFGESESRASAAIARLKTRGYWMPEFDHFRFPAIFAELDGSSTLGVFVDFLERLQDECEIDVNSSRLASRAENFARLRGVSFGEALDRVRQMQVEDAALSRAVAAGLRGARLSQLAYELVRSRGVTFGDALTEVAEEYPELAR
jgi:hypothetical protein